MNTEETMKKLEIIPAILPMNFAEVEEKVELVKGMVKMIQIDVCDGQFVPNATWPYKKEDDSWERIQNEEQGLPGWEKVDFEIDLMVNEPERVIEEWIIAGATRIVLHIESDGNVSEAVDMLTGRVEIGLALSIDTPIEALEPFRDRIQFVQCMGIDHVGFQGQEFNDMVVEKVRAITQMYPELLVTVDGGVSLETGAQLVEAGVDRLVVGSAIFEADNFTEAIQQFKALPYKK
jgi:ribulose-phosphate 3-epimerase